MKKYIDFLRFLEVDGSRECNINLDRRELFRASIDAQGWVLAYPRRVSLLALLSGPPNVY